MSDHLNITFKIQGTPEEGGHVVLRDFLIQMELFLSTLMRFDALADDKGTARVYYRIVNATHNSPLTVEVEPVGIKNASKSRIKEGHDKYFSELFRIQRGEAPSPDVDDKTLGILKRFARPKSKKIGNQEIHNSGENVVLDGKFVTNLTKALGKPASSIGSLRGSLEALNLHGREKRFWIYPMTGPNRVECTFLPGETQKVKALIGKHVNVTGLKHFRPSCPHPHKIEVTTFYEMNAVHPAELFSRVRSFKPYTGVTAEESLSSDVW